ncbi:MAG: teichoic acid biosynthesis protein [Deltaproteobacteria bacterium]|nr:teichoic acid biosynthesis protein [Deltaproteobacteria bacterium]
MKVLYGVTGEGMGHAMRSRVILEHLLAADHDLEIIASGKAAEYLGKRFAGVSKIHGLHMVLEENRVRKGKTLWSNVLKGVMGVPGNIATYFAQVDKLEPDVVISDFESWTYLYGKSHRLPILSIDNMQVIHRCELPREIIEDNRVTFELTKAFIKAKLPGCDAYYITSFFQPPTRKPDTYLFPPILRPEILDAKAAQGDHLLVYQSGSEALETALAKTGLECRIYNMRPGLKEEVVDGKLRFRPFSEAGFIEDLATSRAVIGAGGFTLMGEAVYLHKPMLSLPLEDQFEQMLNARYLEHEGYGMWSESFDDPTLIPRFLERVPECARKLAGYSQDRNAQILAAVDEFLVKAANEPR